MEQFSEPIHSTSPLLLGKPIPVHMHIRTTFFYLIYLPCFNGNTNLRDWFRYDLDEGYFLHLYYILMDQNIILHYFYNVFG